LRHDSATLALKNSGNGQLRL
jgi:hypothetical protein